MKRHLSIIIFLLCATGILPCSAKAENKLPFQVIVNSKNPHERLDEKNLKKLFLKKMKTWPKFKEQVAPVDLAENSSLRESFSKIILRQNVASVITYWQKQTFAARGAAPRKFPSDQKVIDYVAEFPGAIGYISASEKVSNPNIKVIDVKLTKAAVSDIAW